MTAAAPQHEIGVGLISVGWMGKVHSRAYTAVPVVYPELGVRPRLVHAADTAAERTRYAADVLGYARTSADHRAVLADPEVDVVSICAPNALHVQMGVAAAQAGRPFWIEKPAGRDAAETGRIAAAAAAAGVATTVGFNYRHAPAVQHLRGLVADGALGRITNMRAVFFSGYAAEARAALSWRFRRDLAGSGALGDLLSHAVDLVQHVIGPITDVCALTQIVHSERPDAAGAGTHFDVVTDPDAPMGEVDNEDHVAVLARIAPAGGGPVVVGTLEASRAVVGPRCGLVIEVYGTGGAATWAFERMNELRLCTQTGPHQGYTTVHANAAFGEYARFQPGPGVAMGYDDLKVIEARNFLAAVTGQDDRTATIADAVAVAEVLSAAETAARIGTWRTVALVTAPPSGPGRGGGDG